MVWEEHIVISIEMNKSKDPYQILQIWFSSSFPIGSYAYSHGLEALIDEKKINNNPFELNNLKNILLPNTMGELFKALILSKNINQDLLSIKEFNQLEKL